MRKIIFDTNFILAPVQMKADVYSAEGEFYTLKSCINELEKISREKTKRGMQARVALEILKSKGMKIIKTPTNADNSLIEYANKGYIIATNDKDMIKRLKKLGHNVIRIKQKRTIIEE